MSPSFRAGLGVALVLGTATYRAVQGGTLSFKKMGHGWVVMDGGG